MPESPAPNPPPRHVAIIMDGNGRWAAKRGLPRLAGHREGAESVRVIVQTCQDVGVRYLTLYAFSTENWSRPKTEIDGLMRLLTHFLKHEEKQLHDNHVRLRTIGRIEALPAAVRTALAKTRDATAGYDRGHLILALNYGGRDEITDAVKRIAAQVRAGTLSPEDINEALIARHLYEPDIPDPDLLIRTSGELRISNFLLWQASYSEMYVTDVLWPDFRDKEFRAALLAYGKRKRRFGGTGEDASQS